MKRFIAFVVIFLLTISLYHDLTKGSRPAEIPRNSIHYQSVVARPGDTVLSIAEEINDPERLPASLTVLIADFSELNPKADPYALVTGQSYFFPIYD